MKTRFCFDFNLHSILEAVKTWQGSFYLILALLLNEKSWLL